MYIDGRWPAARRSQQPSRAVIAEQLFVVEQGFGKAGRPEADRREHGALHVCIARHGRIDVRACQVEQSLAECAEQVGDVMKLLFTVQARIDEDLIVARTRGMNFFACLAHLFGQIILDAGVDVFIGLGDGKLTFRDELQDVAQLCVQALVLLVAQHADFGKHSGVGQRSPDVVANQAIVEQAVLRCLEAFHLFVQAVAFLPEFGHTNCP